MLNCGLFCFVTSTALMLFSTVTSQHGKALHVGHKKQSHPEVLALWIDGKQIERFAGVPMDIYIIKNGAIASYLQDAYFDSQLPIMPPDVDFVELTWKAEAETFTYKFSDLKSLDPSTLYDPLLSIPANGYVPKKKSIFQLAIPCTGRQTGIASMYISLNVYKSNQERIHGSPLKFHLRKRCVAFESRKLCRHTCKNGGKCNDLGRCECKPGYYGLKCENAVCFPQCLNNGTCVSPGKCTCHDGFHGDRCELAVCTEPCLNGGSCIEKDLCKCPPTHYGEYCQYKSGTCDVPCINGGSCSQFNTCVCLDGYNGQFCQKGQSFDSHSLCKRWCGVHGKCVDVNLCECHRGWRGKLCNKTAKFFELDDGKNGNQSKKRRRRKLRHSETPFRFESQKRSARKADEKKEKRTSKKKDLLQ